MNWTYWTLLLLIASAFTANCFMNPALANEMAPGCMGTFFFTLFVGSAVYLIDRLIGK